MGTWFGLATTIAFWTCLAMFFSLKLTRLISGSNPLISAAAELDYWGPDEKVDLVKSNMVGAF
jgi:hypothetical protein